MLSLFHRGDHARPAKGLALLTSQAGKLRLRGLQRRDAPLLTTHLLRLPPEDRRSRFHGAMPDTAIAAYVARIDWRSAYIFGAFLDNEMRGISELVIDPDGQSGEVAVSCEPGYQHTGLGRMLVLAAMLAGRRLGLATIRLSYQARNNAMRGLARQLGAVTQNHAQTIDGVIALHPPAGA